MKLSLARQRPRTSSNTSHKVTPSQAQNGDVANPIVIVAPRPQVTVLSPTPDPWQQVPALTVSALALFVSLFVMWKNLSQKRNEHRAIFFHKVVIDTVIEPIITFFEELLLFAENTGDALGKTIGKSGHDEAVRKGMREVRDRKRKAANKVAVLASAFNADLEDQLQALFDEVADSVEEFIEARANGDDDFQPQISLTLATQQRRMIAILREFEFELGWPSRFRRVRAWLGRRIRSTGDFVAGNG